MILVTGATGRVGTELVRELVARGEPVRAFVRDAAAVRSHFDPRVEIFEGDLDRPETIAAALEGADGVFLLTPSSEAQPAQERAVLEAVEWAGVEPIVKLSVLGADDASPLQLGRWHRAGERALEESGVEYTILRASSFMQNLYGMSGSIASDGAIYTAAQGGKVGMVDVRDIAAVAAAALTEEGHEGQTYVVTGPEAVSYGEAAAVLSRATGKRIEHVSVPREQLAASLQQAGLPEWYAEDMAALQEGFAAGRGETVTDVVRDVAKREPRTLEAFAQEHGAAIVGQA